MIHTDGELGNLQTVVTETRENVFGKDQTAAFPRKVDGYWKIVEERLRLKTNLFRAGITCKVHIFIDSLPNPNTDPDIEKQLVEYTLQDLINKGFPAYRLIDEFRTAGATVHGTEDPKLLVKELEYQEESKSRFMRGEEIDVIKGKELLEARDKAIIECVHKKISDGETAIIFIGRLHNVIGPLSKPPYNFKIIKL
ncbi:MAG: hypothetical protein PHW31_03830 [Candidatus Pacebacteria bacterium]|nr:hypothetical protein [Candidatus Paceibacterota bacterium]